MLTISAKCIFIFLIATTTTFLANPFVNRIGLKLNIIDKPNHRKIHEKAIVRFGGVSILLGFITSLIIFFISFGSDYLIQAEFLIFTKVLCGAFVFFIVGILDDLFQISPFIRLFLQVITSLLLVINGIGIFNLDISFINEKFYFELNSSFAFLITTLWIVGVTNSINWIDGLDGLSSGFSIIFTIAILMISISLGNLIFAFSAVAIIGACTSFLFYNFRPAKIMMGDSGSYFLGYTLATFSIYYHSNSSINFNPFLSLLILLVPIADMTYVIAIRILNSRSPFFPDRNHIHHRLLDFGFDKDKTLLFIYGLSIISISLAIIIFFSINLFINYMIGCFLFFVFIKLMFYKNRQIISKN